jgi:hypothetical protein
MSMVKQQDGTTILYFVRRDKSGKNVDKFACIHMILTHQDIFHCPEVKMVLPPIIYQILGGVTFTMVTLEAGEVLFFGDVIHTAVKCMDDGPNVAIVAGMVHFTTIHLPLCPEIRSITATPDRFISTHSLTFLRHHHPTGSLNIEGLEMNLHRRYSRQGKLLVDGTEAEFANGGCAGYLLAIATDRQLSERETAAMHGCINLIYMQLDLEERDRRRNKDQMFATDIIGIGDRSSQTKLQTFTAELESLSVLVGYVKWGKGNGIPRPRPYHGTVQFLYGGSHVGIITTNTPVTTTTTTHIVLCRSLGGSRCTGTREGVV